jgi:hypothetical protein
MKTPRVKDFDPDAKVPALKSPLDNMPSIEKPRLGNNKKDQSFSPLPLSSAQHQGKTVKTEGGEAKSSIVMQDVRAVLPVPPVRVVPLVPSPHHKKRVMKQRHPFDIYQDQYDALVQISKAERMQGGTGSMSAMVRGVLDKLIAEKLRK